jgi:hypothetical protein
MAESYSTERLFALSGEIAKGYSEKHIELGDTGFGFTTIVSDKMDVWTDSDIAEADGVVAKIYEPGNRDKLMIEIRRVRFDSFAEAQTAGYGFLSLNGYNRIIQNKEKGNTVFGFLTASEFDETSGYGKMARAAVISHGKEVLIVHATFDYDDYPAYEDALGRFFGGIKMDDPSKAVESLSQQTAKKGEVFLYPRDWQVQEIDSRGKPEGTSDYNLSLEGAEYPNLVVHIRPADLAKGREVAADMISALTKQIDDNPQVAFTGQPEMETYKGASGQEIAHGYVRSWEISSGGQFMSEIYVQRNSEPSSISVLGLNSYDVRRHIASFDEETRQIIFKAWVEGVSAYSIAKWSLAQQPQDFSSEFDLRAIGR